MQINVIGHHLEITPAIKSITESKLARLQHHFDRIQSINVIYHVEHFRHIAEATVHIPKLEIHARSEDDDLYKAIDLLVDKLDAQLIKHKEKLQAHRDRE